jgi:hypothetical protein
MPPILKNQRELLSDFVVRRRIERTLWQDRIPDRLTRASSPSGEREEPPRLCYRRATIDLRSADATMFPRTNLWQSMQLPVMRI